MFLQQYKRLGIVVDAPAERAQQHAAIAMARSVSAHLPDVPAGLQQHDFIHGHYPLHPAQGISMQAPEGRSDDGSHRFSQHARHQCDDVLRDLLGLYTEMPSESAARAYRELPDTPEMLSHPLLPSSPPFMVPIYSGHPVMGCHAVPQRHPGGCCQAVTASNVYMGTPSRSPPKLGTPPRSPPKSHPHMGSAPRHPPYLATPPHGQSTVGDPSGSSHFMGTPLRGQSAPTHDPHTPLQITHRTPYQNQSEASTAVLHPDPFNLRHAPSSAVLNPCMMMSPALQASMRDPGITHTQDILTNMTLPEPGCLLDDDITAADMAAQWFVADPIHGCSSQDMTP